MHQENIVNTVFLLSYMDHFDSTVNRYNIKQQKQKGVCVENLDE